MTDSDGVIEDSPALESDGPQDYEGRMVDALNEMQADDVTEESSTSAPPSEEGETEPDSDESSAATTDAENAEVEAIAENQETIPKDSFLKRINGLQASKRKLEERSLDQDKELAEYREAFRILQGRAYNAERKLSEYEEVDPRDTQIQQMQQEKEAQQTRQRLEAEHHQRIKEVEKQSFVETRADEIIQTANSLAKKYPTLTAEEIVYKFRVSDKPMDVMAKAMHDKRYSYLKDNMARDRKKPKAPRSVKAQGAMAPVGGFSEDDMVAYLDAKGA